jgi:hypothetical protein
MSWDRMRHILTASALRFSRQPDAEKRIDEVESHQLLGEGRTTVVRRG